MRRSIHAHLTMEYDPVSEMLRFLVFSIPDDGQSPEIRNLWVLYKTVRTLYIPPAHLSSFSALYEGTPPHCVLSHVTEAKEKRSCSLN